MRITVHYHEGMAPHRFERMPGFPFWTVSLSLTGRTHFTQPSPTIVEPRTLVLIRPGTPYLLEVPRRERYAEFYALFLMPSDWKMWNRWPDAFPGGKALRIDNSAVARQLAATFRTACAHSAIGEAGEELALNSIERVLLLANLLVDSSRIPLVDERIAGALDFARSRLGAKMDVNAMAGSCHMSPSRFAHLFVEQLGDSPMRHLEGLRMRRAQEMLLSTRMRVREIAQAVGYENPYHFSDRFRSRVGRSPRAFREKPI